LIDIEIFNESGSEVPVHVEEFVRLAESICNGENKVISWLEIVFVDEEGIVEINSKFLNKSYVTDVITFSYSDDLQLNNSEIEGTIYMCNNRIQEQANELGVPLNDEFRRIFIHGVLHLCGYDDKTEEQKNRMTALENRYLN
jgi:probable rRNA maturation factor